jgi:hypothetical protein
MDVKGRPTCPWNWLQTASSSDAASGSDDQIDMFERHTISWSMRLPTLSTTSGNGPPDCPGQSTAS